MWWYVADGGLRVFFFQAEDGIRGAQESRGLGDVYKRQAEEASVSMVRLRNKSVQ